MYTESVNLARRLSAHSEPNLLQDYFYDDDVDNINTTKNYCEMSAASVTKLSDFPSECKKYADIMESLRRRLYTHDNGSPFAGMRPGEAASAMAARDKGKLNHVQIQRRMTNNKSKSLW